ncbi:hypothetical protein ACIQBJ_14495 [Kitasatospora sp. NPDC088391]|uniref:hypothetical protein n=1 Tax=Kitasatospora sp. NPDC088391 TaxID=3364074 RepID=UPI00381C9143
MNVLSLIARLPAVPVLRDRSRALAVLDAVLSPEWEWRYFSYDAHWASGQEMASMRNGSGDEYSLVLTPDGVFARGFDHESPMSPYRTAPLAPWPGLLDTVPAVFRPQVEEPAFCDDGVLRATVCFWRETHDTAWRTGDLAPLPPGQVDDGSAGWLFDVLAAGTPEAYQEFAEDYYETTVDLDAVRHVFALRPLTEAVVTALNPEQSLAGLAADLAETGYPTTT